MDRALSITPNPNLKEESAASQPGRAGKARSLKNAHAERPPRERLTCNGVVAIYLG